MKGINRANVHHLSMEKLHILTTHIGKQVNIFGFSKFCKFLFDFSYANLYGFLDFLIFYFDSCNTMKALKIEFDISYLLWGSSLRLASDSLLLVGIKHSPTVVSPPLLL
jgi:hypothetical protein